MESAACLINCEYNLSGLWDILIPFIAATLTFALTQIGVWRWRTVDQRSRYDNAALLVASALDTYAASLWYVSVNLAQEHSIHIYPTGSYFDPIPNPPNFFEDYKAHDLSDKSKDEVLRFTAGIMRRKAELEHGGPSYDNDNRQHHLVGIAQNAIDLSEKLRTNIKSKKFRTEPTTDLNDIRRHINDVLSANR